MNTHTIYSLHSLRHVAYQNLYILEPGEKGVVESSPDATGLKIAILYGVNPVTQEMLYQLFQCKNDDEFTVTGINGQEVTGFGGKITKITTYVTYCT